MTVLISGVRGQKSSQSLTALIIRNDIRQIIIGRQGYMERRTPDNNWGEPERAPH